MRSDAGRMGRRDGARREGSRARPEREAERAFDQAVARVRESQQAHELARRDARLHALADAADLFAEVEADAIATEPAQQRWDALDLDTSDRRRLEPRWHQAQDARGAVEIDPAREQAAERWLVQAELDAGIDSPVAAQALRRECQMERLANRLQGAATGSIDALERLLTWAETGPLASAPRTERRARVARIVALWSQTSAKSR
jgi:hypothetical protein